MTEEVGILVRHPNCRKSERLQHSISSGFPAWTNQEPNKIPDQWIDLTNTNQLSINIVPNRKVKLVGSDMNIFFLARIVISIKPSSESRDIPIGFKRWCVDLQLDLGQTSHHTYFHTLL